ncbi:peptide deformylase [Patescibacteria group bacterium]|nr:peptide deformylase [Patescibacteria group bacterium]MBU1683560.1 peptide deformylase [Patescibacteria group bacterium]MBU1934846.1 peptide deformylase [Patescibacteria group bacterium]
MILNIETGRDNPILRKESDGVKEITKKTIKLIKDMEETMVVAKGAGLAAPQVGINVRIILITLDNKKILTLINPKIISASDKTAVDEEGCLSLPGEWGKVRRPFEITVQFQTIKGRQLVMKFDNFEAREIQHEIDHLDGVLFVDHLGEGDITLDNLSAQTEVEKI